MDFISLFFFFHPRYNEEASHDRYTEIIVFLPPRDTSFLGSRQPLCFDVLINHALDQGWPRPLRPEADQRSISNIFPSSNMLPF